MPEFPWSRLPLSGDHFRSAPREYGILPFWFLNGELDPDEMRYQLREFREKGMPGIILHGRYGLEMPYIGEKYLQRIRFAVEEAEKLGLHTWIYDEMNWPSGTADHRVLKERPDLAQPYLECISLTVRGPWFTYLTGADSRYLDFERSTPVAAFALGSDGQVIDLTPNLSFTNVIPWEAPAGNWRLLYIVEKKADYYIDALNPESTREFLRLGYEPYARAVGEKMTRPMVGFYTDEPAMHYFLTGGDNPVVPWTKDMFRRFKERNGYNLRLRLPDLFFDVSPDSARVRHDFYETLTEFYSDAFYRQIHEWCQEHDVLFTGHLLYEEWLRRMVRVEGNLFKHYRHMDVIGVDHLYPIVGSQDRPDEHVAMKVGSSAAHQLGSERLLCESFGGIFMDATMQRMKWIADWEYVLGVNLLNPHGFHYTLEGPRKRDWPPSMFYQYPWWHYYQGFSDYISRLSYMLTGGRHVARAAVIWPIHSVFATYTPQARSQVFNRTEFDFNALTDMLLRVHYDFDYLDEDMLAEAEISGGSIVVGEEDYPLLVLPPMPYIKLSTLERMEQFVAGGGRVLGMIILPTQAFGPDGLVDISGRVQALFGVDPCQILETYTRYTGVDLFDCEHKGGGKTTFLHSYALARQLPLRLQKEVGTPGIPEHPNFVIEPEGDSARYYFVSEDGRRQDITDEVREERQIVTNKLRHALNGLVAPDVEISSSEVLYLHRVRDGQDIYFLINSTHRTQESEVVLNGAVQPWLWDPSRGSETPITPLRLVDGRTHFKIALPPVGSAFVIPRPIQDGWISETNVTIDALDAGRVLAYGTAPRGYIVVQREGRTERIEQNGGVPGSEEILDEGWEFEAESPNALVIGEWLAAAEKSGEPVEAYAAPQADTTGWQRQVPGAWSFQLPAEPEQAYPIPVWYRIPFHITDLPSSLSLIVDGFAGAEWQLYVNGREVTSQPQRSPFDSQMLSLEIGDYIQTGENLVAVRLVLRDATDGITDLLKLTGNFRLEGNREAGYSITAPQRAIRPAAWTEQGYPFFSGRGVYRCRFQAPDTAGRRIFLEIPAQDDVVEVVLNGRPVGVCLWDPYRLEITGELQQGENLLELRFANTLINLMEGTPRPSGLMGPPVLVQYNHFTFEL